MVAEVGPAPEPEEYPPVTPLLDSEGKQVYINVPAADVVEARFAEVSKHIQEFGAMVIQETMRAHHLRELKDAIGTAQHNLDDAVLEARQAGMTWLAIGNAVGMAQQSAVRKWGKLEKKRSRKK